MTTEPNRTNKKYILIEIPEPEVDEAPGSAKVYNSDYTLIGNVGEIISEIHMVREPVPIYTMGQEVPKSYTKRHRIQKIDISCVLIGNILSDLPSPPDVKTEYDLNG